MLYRPFGKTGENVSALGFGCMRLPVLGGERDKIDIPLATEMLHYAIDHGVNYVDTAWMYHGAAFEQPGNSEPFVGDALQGGYREKVLLATKLPVFLVNSRADMDRLLNIQLERLKTDCIDCYLLHGLNGKAWPKMHELKILDFLEDAKADGRIRYAGFSFHDERPEFMPIVDAFSWDFCQIQYNYMDVNVQAGAAGLAYAADKGLAVIVMEPLKGGRLACAPAAIQDLWDSAPVKRSPADWALRFVWNDPRVSLLLSGMSAMDQVVTNVRVAEEAKVDSLTAEELQLIERVRQAYLARTVVDCTACRYCMPCPQNINIPGMFSGVNDAALFDSLADERAGYQMMLGAGFSAPVSACEDCGQCEDMCPQHLSVREELKKAAEILG